MERQKPKMIRAEVVDKDGNVKTETVNIDKLKIKRVRQSTLDETQKKRATLLFGRVGRYLPGMTMEKWLDGFTFDRNPVREMEIWEHIDDVVDQLWTHDATAALNLTRKDVLRVVVALSVNAVDIPAQVRAVNDEYVALARSVFTGSAK